MNELLFVFGAVATFIVMVAAFFKVAELFMDKDNIHKDHC